MNLLVSGFNIFCLTIYHWKRCISLFVDLRVCQLGCLAQVGNTLDWCRLLLSYVVLAYLALDPVQWQTPSTNLSNLFCLTQAGEAAF